MSEKNSPPEEGWHAQRDGVVDIKKLSYQRRLVPRRTIEVVWAFLWMPACAGMTEFIWQQKMKHKLKILMCVLMSLPVLTAFADDPHYYGTPPDGWYWGRVAPVEELKKETLPKTGIQTLEVVQRAVNEAKARAILDPTPEHVWKYLVLQHWMQNTATHFSEAALDVMAFHPELNFEIKNPETSSIRQVQLQTEQVQKEMQAKALASTNGLFFFYRGANPMDLVQAEADAQFAKDYGFSLIGIPVDGKAYDKITNRDEAGQAQRLGVKAYPALFLVNPESQAVTLIHYGYSSRDELLSTLVKRAVGEAGIKITERETT